MLYEIKPYRYMNVWAFDDIERGLIKEGLVAGIDVMLDVVSHGADKLTMCFSDNIEDASDWMIKLEYQKSEKVEYDGEVAEPWHLYTSSELDLGGWLCPNLLRYFPTPPPSLYINIFLD